MACGVFSIWGTGWSSEEFLFGGEGRGSQLVGTSIWGVNNYIVRSYRDVIVVTNTATRRTSKA